TYTVTMKNVGTEALYNLKLFESMEIGLTPDLPETLLPGASVTLTGAYTVPNDNPPDSVANTVTVTGAGVSTQDDYYSDSASVSVAVVENPDAILALTKQATANIQAGALRARPGDTVTYVFTVRNFSNELAEDVRITDPALADNIIISALGPGETATFSRTAAIPGDYTETSFDNTATVSTDFSSERVEQDTASASVPVQLVELTKTANIDFEEGVAPGSTVTYIFTRS